VRAQVVVVAGPSGSGKSRLCERLAAEHGLPVVHLDDGDELTITASAPGPDGTRIGFGEVTGRVAPARPER